MGCTEDGTAMSGLTRKKVTVKGKRGTYQRSVMVRAGEKVKRFVSKHKGKIAVAAGAAVVGLGVAAHLSAKSARKQAVHDWASAVSRGATRSAAAAAHASNFARNMTEDLKRAQAKIRQDTDHLEKEIGGLRRQWEAKQHGRHDIRDLRQAYGARRDQGYRSASNLANTDYKRGHSAAMSGHFSHEQGYDMWGRSKVRKVTRHRLGSGS